MYSRGGIFLSPWRLANKNKRLNNTHGNQKQKDTRIQFHFQLLAEHFPDRWHSYAPGRFFVISDTSENSDRKQKRRMRQYLILFNS